MKQKILITGSSGYIGSHFTKYFSQNGYEVVGLDIKQPPLNLQKYLSDYIVTDIADQESVHKMISKNAIQSIIHCAGKSIVQESVQNPDLYFDTNVQKASSFLQTCIENKVKNFIFSSTAAVYGQPQYSPIDEGHPLLPINPYGESKKEFERILLKSHHEGKVRVGIFRYFNACGADFDGELGEDHEPETHLIPNIFKASLAGKPVSIFGTDYDTLDGTCIRDYVHVWDLAKAHHRLLEKMQSGITETVFNLGTNHGYSIMEILSHAEKVVGKKIERIFASKRQGDPSILVASGDLAKKALGWEPAHSDLASILESAYKWHQKAV